MRPQKTKIHIIKKDGSKTEHVVLAYPPIPGPSESPPKRGKKK